jgi:hypothetical protein
MGLNARNLPHVNDYMYLNINSIHFDNFNIFRFIANVILLLLLLLLLPLVLYYYYYTITITPDTTVMQEICHMQMILCISLNSILF